MTSRLFLADLRRHLLALASRRVKMRGAKMSGSVPHGPGAARRAAFTNRQTTPFILPASFAGRSSGKRKLKSKLSLLIANVRGKFGRGFV
jgi:hypothetical protein